MTKGKKRLEGERGGQCGQSVRLRGGEGGTGQAGVEAGTRSHSLFATCLKELDFLLRASGECGWKDFPGWCEDGG